MSFTRLAADYLDDLARRHPAIATGRGDHRFDAQLPPVMPDVHVQTAIGLLPAA